MLIKLLVFGVTVALINTEISAQYTYEIYEVYPQQTRPNNQYYQPQTTPRYYYPPRKTYNPTYNQNPYQYYPTRRPVQQQNPQVTVSEAEWICTNQRTNDMMIIATDDLGSRSNGPIQWHQVNRPNNQPNNVQPQITFGNPTIPTVNPTYTTTTTTTTERGPIWPSDNNQPPVNPTTERYTTTEREPGPVWPSGNDVTTKKPVYTTTPRPLGPIWSSGDENGKKDDGHKGFTVDDPSTTKQPFFNNPFFDPTTQKPKPTTTTTTPYPDDDEGGIEIIMGK